MKTLEIFASAVSTLYARMVSGDNTVMLLKEMSKNKHIYRNGLATDCVCLDDSVLENDWLKPLHYCQSPIPSTSSLMKAEVGETDIYSVVFSDVRGQQVIDLHTHLLPPSHGALCLWGIDELLTYHYLVAEYFIIAPPTITPEGFYSMSKREQADLIWDALFIQRSPISEATRGILTTLVSMGLEAHLKERDLNAIRSYYDTFRNEGLSGVERFVEKVYEISGVRYAIMTNIPFSSIEAQHWRPKKKVSKQRMHILATSFDTVLYITCIF